MHKNVQMPSQGASGLVLKVTHSAQMIPHMRQSQFPRLSLALVSNSVLDSQIPWLFLFRHCLRASGIPKPTAYISPRCESQGRFLESNAECGSNRDQCSTLDSGSNGRARWWQACCGRGVAFGCGRPCPQELVLVTARRFLLLPMLSALLRGRLRPMMQCDVTNGTALVGVLPTVNDRKGFPQRRSNSPARVGSKRLMTVRK